MVLVENRLVRVETYYNPRDRYPLPVDHIVEELERAILAGPSQEKSQFDTPANRTSDGFSEAVLVEVIDGDTIYVLALGGMRKGGGEVIRAQLYGIDAQERGSSKGDKAFNHLRLILPEKLQVRPVSLDECGRWVMDVLPRVAEENTLTFSEILILNGYASAVEDTDIVHHS